MSMQRCGRGRRWSDGPGFSSVGDEVVSVTCGSAPCGGGLISFSMAGRLCKGRIERVTLGWDGWAGSLPVASSVTDDQLTVVENGQRIDDRWMPEYEYNG